MTRGKASSTRIENLLDTLQQPLLKANSGFVASRSRRHVCHARHAGRFFPPSINAVERVDRIIAQGTTGFSLVVIRFQLHRGGAMADLSEEQKESYWSYNVKLTTILLIIWFVVTYLISGLWAGWLNQYSFLGFPLGYYMAAQGSLAIFVIEIAVYAKLMNKLDHKYGIREEG
jgi:putative solute:sodium symporter small subunit